MRPKISPLALLSSMMRNHLFTLSGSEFREAYSNLMTQLRVSKTGKSSAWASGINFRFGNKPGRYMPHQGERECAGRRWKASKVNHGT